ncbi:hypothetical protein HYH03_004228 [Edaphochlamys debaryana]|uniref:M23ase beta-sheet core domain-containing protein n=1 Tax=Edaphochlamys debaryana TaxID=47281 RepID=A0A836C3N9_9CHLO|nr:hypothetical protein HYH03_004228 [Edaphochlamys debaryana]|eukprot:KAG2497967.1 hypothetical protein HYH03_004228 [Edaphochlamys debaryana]
MGSLERYFTLLTLLALVALSNAGLAAAAEVPCASITRASTVGALAQSCPQLSTTRALLRLIPKYSAWLLGCKKAGQQVCEEGLQLTVLLPSDQAWAAYFQRRGITLDQATSRQGRAATQGLMRCHVLQGPPALHLADLSERGVTKPTRQGPALVLSSDGQSGTGGTVQAPGGLLQIQFPPNAFQVPSAVTVVPSILPPPEDFEGANAMFDVGLESSAVVDVTAPEQPLLPMSVSLQLAAFGVSSPASGGEAAILLFLSHWDDTGDESDEELWTWESTGDRVPANATQIDTELQPEAFFYDPEAGLWRARLMLGQTNPDAPPAVRRSAVQAVSGVEAAAVGGAGARSRDRGGEAERTGVEGGARRALLAPAGSTGKCKGTKLRRPVTNDAYTSNHRTSMQVMAAQDGTMTVYDERGKDGKYKGWGRYIVIRNKGGGATLYAHLDPASTPAKGSSTQVTAGDPIAMTGNTGRGSGFHLHFEYAPNGRIFANKVTAKVDPLPCTELLAEGSISVRDNGSAADDAFQAARGPCAQLPTMFKPVSHLSLHRPDGQVFLDGVLVCQTDIGAANSCTLGALRPGNYLLELHVLIAPDDIGTYEITVNESHMFLCYDQDYLCGANATGDPPEGSNEVYWLKVCEPGTIC